jgi:hypothetical protein
MSSTTPRVGLYMPNDDGSEPVNVATDINDNLEKIDSSIGFVPSTAASPPATPFDGMATYETDTGQVKFRKGGVWNYLLSAGATFVGNILLSAASKIGIGNASPAAVVDVIVSSIASTPIFAKFKQTSDTQPRLQIDSDGIRIGSGSATADTRIYRPTANQLSITGSVSMANDLTVAGTSSIANLGITGDLAIDGVVSSDLYVVGDIYGEGLGFISTIRKPADTSRLNTATISNDTDFLVNLAANTTYFIELFVMYSGNTTGDIRLAWSAPVGAVGYRWSLGEAVAGTDRETTTMRTGVHGLTTEVIYGAHSTALWVGLQETMIITNSTTAGNLTLRWAQGTANNTDATVIRAGSLMQIRKVA